VLRADPFEFEGAPDMVNIEYMWFGDLGGDATAFAAGRRELCTLSGCS
jgi:hypothetical protein